MDEDLERDFSQFCGERSVHREAEDRLQIRQNARNALAAIRADRVVNNEREWTLDEINAEIDAVRRERVR